jgi:D-alanyl-D-alanine dipeptidase
MRPPSRRALIAALALLPAAAAAAQDASPAERSLRAVEADPDFVRIKDGPGVKVALRYATPDNFMHADLYGAFDRAYLRRLAASKFARAVALLRREHPGWRFLIWDALRPRSVQRLFWAQVVGTPRQKYVGDPDRGSIHNFGLALDLTLEDAAGQPLDMGTGFDDFTPLAEPDQEAELVRSGRLTAAQEANRLILRGLMTRAGFHTIPEEWWHFDALPIAEVKARFKIVE